jgi:hypothetical protein
MFCFGLGDSLAGVEKLGIGERLYVDGRARSEVGPEV